jgi:hypothetical protein
MVDPDDLMVACHQECERLRPHRLVLMRRQFDQAAAFANPALTKEADWERALAPRPPGSDPLIRGAERITPMLEVRQVGSGLSAGSTAFAALYPERQQRHVVARLAPARQQGIVLDPLEQRGGVLTGTEAQRFAEVGLALLCRVGP